MQFDFTFKIYNKDTNYKSEEILEVITNVVPGMRWEK